MEYKNLKTSYELSLKLKSGKVIKVGPFESVPPYDSWLGE